MTEFPIYYHTRYDVIFHEDGKMHLTCTDVSDHDFVEVVRCRDCINWNGNDCITMYGMFAPKPNDYCSRSERWNYNG